MDNNRFVLMRQVFRLSVNPEIMVSNKFIEISKVRCDESDIPFKEIITLSLNGHSKCTLDNPKATYDTFR